MEINKLLKQPFVRVILSNKKDKSYAYNKAVIVPMKLKGKSAWQMTKYTDKQAFQENLMTLAELTNCVKDLFENKYKQLNYFGQTEDIELKQSKKGKLLVGKHKHAEVQACALEHNRTKKHILNEGEKIPALIDIGVMTKEGKIIHAQADKFRQINKFLEIIDDTLKTWKRKDIKIIDFGCGKSYLTFILYHYLTKIKRLKAKIIGLDLKSEVIEKCNIIAEKYKYADLSFEIGNIDGYTPKEQIDMVISLHACDTATDFAFYNAIQWNVPIILSVPCCQHEINAQIKNSWPVITKYGLLKERFSAILTDAIRANLLESKGYSVQVLEFIDMEHTPKNILIRAIKTGNNVSSKPVQETCEEFGINPTLNKLLNGNEQQKAGT